MLPDRFWDKVHVNLNGCWEWLGYKIRGGYGAIKWQGRTHCAHRVAYECLIGPIPKGLELDHLCRNRGCVRPDHLEPVTHSENIRRGQGPYLTRLRHQEKTSCPQGHPYSGTNLRVRPNGKRDCRACDRDYKRRIRARSGR